MQNKVKMSLDNLNGNAFAIIGAYSKAARKQGIDEEHIDKVINDMTSGDYNNLLRVLMENIGE